MAKFRAIVALSDDPYAFALPHVSLPKGKLVAGPGPDIRRDLAMTDTIGNPLSWAFSAIGSAFGYGKSVADAVQAHALVRPEIRTLKPGDLRGALRKGWEDLTSFRSDVVFVCLLYPIIGGLLAALAYQGNMVHLFFPVLSGFALTGPVAAVGLYEMSRRREQGQPTNWLAYLDVIRSPKFGGILILALFHLVVFSVWIMVANLIFDATLGPEPPSSLSGFLSDVLTTPAGWAMILFGFGIGFLFAVAILAISVVSFPMLLDREVSLPVAVMTSVKVARQNPRVIGTWGLIVAVLLAVGSIPALLGLVLVLPLLGHATWHLYRAAIHWPRS
jgi:uncharacterized membrane protein